MGAIESNRHDTLLMVIRDVLESYDIIATFFRMLRVSNLTRCIYGDDYIWRKIVQRSSYGDINMAYGNWIIVARGQAKNRILSKIEACYKSIDDSDMITVYYTDRTHEYLSEEVKKLFSCGKCGYCLQKFYYANHPNRYCVHIAAHNTNVYCSGNCALASIGNYCAANELCAKADITKRRRLRENTVPHHYIPTYTRKSDRNLSPFCTEFCIVKSNNH
jgi:hypothetical protein